MCTAGVGLLGVAAWTERTRETGALWPFVVFVGILGTLAVSDAIASGALTSLSLVWIVTFLTIPCAFAWFVVEYYGLSYLASPARKVVFVLPALVGVCGGAALILSSTATGSMTGGGPTAPTVPAALGFAALAEQAGIYYAGGLMLAGVGLLARTVTTYEYLDRGLGVALAFVALWPWAAYFVTPSIAGRVGIETIIGLNATGYSLSLVAVGFAVTRGGLFEAAPAAGTLGAESVFADLEDPVVVVDQDDQVVKLNQAAVDTFGIGPAAAVSEPLAAVVGTDITTLETEETVELTVHDGTRQFAASVSPVKDRFGRQPGRAVVISDVTQEQIKSQRLTVLNRVLRHNLRNWMANIMGRAEVIASDGDEYSDSAESILTSADDLMSLSDRVRQVEEMLAATPDVDADVQLATTVEHVVEEYRSEYPDASLSVDIDDSVVVTTDNLTLSHVLDNLVENALAHNDAPTPVVTVSARETDGGVRLAVSDNGPGLPEHERAVIEQGDETALEHGSGLGLWAVHWGVIRLGGELSFQENEPHGTVVTVDLPARPDPEASAPTAAEAD